MSRSPLRWPIAAAAVAAVAAVVAAALLVLGPGSTPPPRPVATPAAVATPTAAAAEPRGGRRLKCAQEPQRCGYPGPETTGVEAGAVLRRVPEELQQGPGWHYDPRGWISIDQPDAVLENVSTASTVDVTGHRATIRNVRIRVGGETFGIALRHVADTLVEHVDIEGKDAGRGRLLVGIKDIFGDSTGTRVRAVDVARTATGIQIYSGVIEDSYIHDMGFRSGDHVNGTTSNGGTELLTIRHNTVLNRFPQTDAVSLFQDFGVESNRVIADNLLAGGGYTIYAGAKPTGERTRNIRITGNRISRLYFRKGGRFGPVTAFDRDGPGNVWSGNVWDEDLSRVGL